MTETWFIDIIWIGMLSGSFIGILYVFLGKRKNK